MKFDIGLWERRDSICTNEFKQNMKMEKSIIEILYLTSLFKTCCGSAQCSHALFRTKIHFLLPAWQSLNSWITGPSLFEFEIIGACMPLVCILSDVVYFFSLKLQSDSQGARGTVNNSMDVAFSSSSFHHLPLSEMAPSTHTIDQCFSNTCAMSLLSEWCRAICRTFIWLWGLCLCDLGKVRG